MLHFSSVSITHTMSTAQEYYVCIKWSMCDLICDVTSCYVWSCDTGKINWYDKIVIENKKKKRKCGTKRNFYFGNGLLFGLPCIGISLFMCVYVYVYVLCCVSSRQFRQQANRELFQIKWRICRLLSSKVKKTRFHNIWKRCTTNAKYLKLFITGLPHDYRERQEVNGIEREHRFALLGGA